MMDILTCILRPLLIMMVADGLIVHSPSGPLVAPLGSSVVLPCYVDELLSMEDLEVEWRRAGSETLVHLYQDGESRPASRHQDYHDRAHFFTDQIQHGNFSLRLDNLTSKDEGKYTCKVYSQRDSGETVVQIKHECLLVYGSEQSVSAYDGEDITLNCSVDSHITPDHIEEVSWIRTDGGILVLLFKNNKTFPDSSHERYRDRVEFFTAEIPKGNFSLRLKSVRTEDKEVYMCKVFSGGLSANATVVLERLGFSSWHIAVLFFCFAAGSGAVLLLLSLIYCRSNNTVSTSNKIWNLQLSLVFCPNICMFLAFILWGFTEGFLSETITCSALYFLRPVMLIWAMPYLKYLQDILKTWIKFFKITRELAIFTVVFYSVIFTYGWRKRAHLDWSGVYFGIVVLLCLILSKGFKNQRWILVCVYLCSPFQLFQLFLMYSFGYPSLGHLIVVMVLSLLQIFIFFLPRLQAKFKFLHHRWITLFGIIVITLLDFILLIYVLPAILETEKECWEWIRVILFIEVLKLIVIFKANVQVTECVVVQRRGENTETSHRRENSLSRCNEVMYMFGAVGVILLSSVTLTAELILKARNGERVLKDLGVIVFPSECVFALYWLVLQMHAYWKIVTTGFTQNSPHRGHPRSTTEDHETENLSAPDPDV
ncbi:uncharacterized protein LOC127952287 [Carassius gibelio]|uniref:uncharacterized protein LOC127952287 n=1 Tax=Carassius gibelio TaxID=101364 RepID=UPI002277ACD3|nr:uncharacterized protein LOC127952287 [Carassius gibelio]